MQNQRMRRARKKLYLNENISHKLVAIPLRELGYDVISSHETGMFASLSLKLALRWFSAMCLTIIPN